MNSLISVIIPVYNTEKYISRCLDSIIKNEYQDLEIICINDGSTDNSLSILKDYQNIDNRIMIIDVPNGGVSKARNLGLDKATGEYICFIDSDDWVHKQFFLSLVYGIEQTSADIAVCELKRISDYIEESENELADINYSVFDNKDGLDNHTIKSYSCGRIYKSGILSNQRFDEKVKISEDTLFNLGVIASNPRIKIVLADVMFYYYFNRADSAINTSNGLDSKILSYIYLERAINAKSKYVAGVYLNDAFKNTFSVRYLTMFINDKALKGEIKGLLSQCLDLEKTCRPFSKAKSFIYKLLVYFPVLYRLYRIVGDCTMIEWEKQQKEKKN